MKKALIAIWGAVVFAFSVQAANDYLWLDYGGDKQRMSRLDLKSMTVCEFKAQVAAKAGLKQTKFDLVRNSFPLMESRTMYDSHIRSGQTITVVEKSISTQC